ncbi:hypothetical protein CDO73_01975 [Saccharibacillus sp. O23]|uniref:Na-translocating system protein MpsC family protein n=1 Tax=Saccharibacillus sp. O23 TaxID=2009338 RepID=UPI000B4E279D|nr:Na-translocating system protein MpsC family protein [Saccharibacillus sp. O23]OWR32398.1 hypothetical protein CDO73_01975 [Saccharibacillus sp. O23]
MLKNDAAKPQIEQLVHEMFELNFGQPPRKIDVNLDERSLVIYLEDFVGSEIQDLVDSKDPDALRSVRELVVEHLLPELKRQIGERTGHSVDSFYYDWSDRNLSGVLIGMFGEAAYRNSSDDYEGKLELHREIGGITYEIEKMPDAIYSYWASPNVLVMIREGILIKIEKAFIDQGASGVLRKVKRTLEKQVLIREGKIGETLDRRLKGLYLDWAFGEDKSFLVCVFEDAETK